MTRTFTYDDALAAIWERSGYDRGFISNPFAGDDAARLGLLRTQGVLDRLGNPERSLRIIHVAGSKGKGSTTVTIDSILRAIGYRTGRFTSPHLHSYRERFIVDDMPISPEDFAGLTQEAITAAQAVEQELPEIGEVTAWELSTAMALSWFSQAQCTFAVIEVGLGGTLDATNVVDPEISVITRLDYEHTAILGSTLAEIASNKAGIIKQEKPVVTAAQEAEGMAVIEEKARETASQVIMAGRDFSATGTDRAFTFVNDDVSFQGLHTTLAGQHQVENASLAIATILAIENVSQETIQSGLDNVVHPGRFDVIDHASGATIVIDGAHSPVAARALSATLAERFPDQHPVFVIAMLQDKDSGSFVSTLAPHAAGWFIAAPASPRALDVEFLRMSIPETGAKVAAFASVDAAISAAISKGSSPIVITGSLTTVAEAQVSLGLAVADRLPTASPRVSLERGEGEAASPSITT